MWEAYKNFLFGRYVIVKKKTYFNLFNGFREKVLVPATKPYITFHGAGRDVTSIEWHDRASDRGPNGQQLRTYNSASVTVLANYFIARNISFKVRFQCTISHLASVIGAGHLVKNQMNSSVKG
jgi:pectin methylesterase-like acyl-CoA thioesterase